MVPDINDAYEEYGSNEAGLFVIAAFGAGSDATCLQWVNDNSVQFPAISGNSGGSDINSTYEISAVPTLILIAPNHDIVEQDIWPIGDLDPTLEEYEINSTGVIEDFQKQQKIIHTLPEISIKNIGSQKISLSVPVEGHYKLSIYSADGRIVETVLNGFLTKGNHEISWNADHLAHGVFFVELRGVNQRVNKKIVLY